MNDSLRADYIKRHAEAALQARREGARLQGYFVWSGWDNFEWVFGYINVSGLSMLTFQPAKYSQTKLL